MSGKQVEIELLLKAVSYDFGIYLTNFEFIYLLLPPTFQRGDLKKKGPAHDVIALRI